MAAAEHGPTPETQAYERLDRHVRTATSLRELAHWNAERERAALSKRHDTALRTEIADRLRRLSGSAGGAEPQK